VQHGPAVLDTDTLSELSRGNPTVRGHALEYLKAFGRFTVSAVTVFERLRGYRLALREGKPYEKQLQAFQVLVANSVVLPFDQEAASVAADLWAGTTRSQRQHMGDLLIAAIAISRQLPLVTRNRRDFERITKPSSLHLPLVDWSRK
jgi:predicted nucleic acid-binding protein